MKSGLDYFPLDVHLDEKFELIEADFGLKGFAVIVKLFQKIYGQRGYYCEWTEEIATLFARNCHYSDDTERSINAVSEIVRAAIKRGIFDKGLYEKYGILTSAGIQKRYLEACARRKEVEVESAYLLLCNTQLFKNVCISRENTGVSPENDDISEQSKVKEKERKQKETDIKVSNAADAPRTRFTPPSMEEVKAYCEERGNRIDPQVFIDYYTANGWVMGAGRPIKDWKACVRTWERRERANREQDSVPDSEYEEMVEAYMPAYRKKET